MTRYNSGHNYKKRCMVVDSGEVDFKNDVIFLQRSGTVMARVIPVISTELTPFIECIIP